jgi:hypothetical protein
VSAREIVVAILGKAERVTLDNDADGHAKLVRLLTRGKASARVCLEATGIYHLDLALALDDVEDAERKTTEEDPTDGPMDERGRLRKGCDALEALIERSPELLGEARSAGCVPGVDLLDVRLRLGRKRNGESHASRCSLARTSSQSVARSGCCS